MQLNRLEAFALEKLWQAPQCDQLAAAKPALRVLERVKTRAGFYSIIQLPEQLAAQQPLNELEWPFRLKRLRARGYFVCWVESPSTLCLEAVISQGECPAELAVDLFV